MNDTKKDYLEYILWGLIFIIFDYLLTYSFFSKPLAESFSGLISHGFKVEYLIVSSFPLISFLISFFFGLAYKNNSAKGISNRNTVICFIALIAFQYFMLAFLSTGTLCCSGEMPEPPLPFP